MNPDDSPVLPRRKTLYHHAATVCLLSPLIGFSLRASYWFLYRVNHLPQSRTGAIVDVVFSEAVLVVGIPGFVLGLIALFGMRRCGPKGILAKVLAGFLMILLMGIPAPQGIHDELVEIAWQPPSMLAKKIAETDRVEISDYFMRPNDKSTRISINGDKAKEIAKAVSFARRDAGHYSSDFGRQIEFYKGTNLLASVRWQNRSFLADEGQFSDNSGVLSDLYHKLIMHTQ